MKQKLYLPNVLRIAFDAAGIEAVITLARRLGGKTIHCPVKGNLTKGHPLVVAAGEVAAQAIADKFGGRTLHIPQGIPVRRMIAMEMIQTGTNLNAIVGASGLNIRSVSRIKAELKSGTTQTWALPAQPKVHDSRQLSLLGDT